MQKSLSLGHLLIGERAELSLIAVQFLPQEPAPLGALGQLGEVTGDVVGAVSNRTLAGLRVAA